MTDQTRWGIDMVQQENKAKAYEEQKEMRIECKEFIEKCSAWHLQEVYAEIKRLKRGNK